MGLWAPALHSASARSSPCSGTWRPTESWILRSVDDLSSAATHCCGVSSPYLQLLAEALAQPRVPFASKETLSTLMPSLSLCLRLSHESVRPLLFKSPNT